MVQSIRRPTSQTTDQSLKRSTKHRRAQRPERDGDTEQRILDAAHSVFLRHGTAGARMQDIAAEAGVNQALLHYYFRSKERLSEAAFRRAARQLLPRVIEVMASGEAIEGKVARVVNLELDHLSRAPYLPGYIISELTHRPERARQLISALAGMTPEDIRPKVLAALQKQIDAQVRAGTMRPIAPEQFMVNLISLCIFPFAARPMLFALLGFDQRAFERFIDQRRQELAPFFLRALRP
jgi:TetR/AcrR family transcriptional regulator